MLDNKIDLDAEVDSGEDRVTHFQFLELIKPAFPTGTKLCDMEDILKRANFIVTSRKYLSVRPGFPEPHMAQRLISSALRARPSTRNMWVVTTPYPMTSRIVWSGSGRG